MSQRKKTPIERAGTVVSDIVANSAAHPSAQVAMILFSVAWFAFGLSANIFSAAMAILAILLTQMVLNKQNEREADAHRRDVAMHAKLDELLIASGHARSEMAGIENLEEDQINEISRRVHDGSSRQQPRG